MYSGTTTMRLPATKGGGRLGVAAFFALILIYYLCLSTSTGGLPTAGDRSTSALGRGAGLATETARSVDPMLVRDIVEYFVDYPLTAPYKNAFGELGRRTRVVRDWLERMHAPPLSAADHAVLLAAVEEVVPALYPFVRSPRVNGTTSRTPLADLRSTFVHGSAGIVIPVGNGIVRYAAHLVVSLRNVLGSSLPIEIAYAGDGDLSPANRARLAEAVAATGGGSNVLGLEFVDITTVIDCSSLQVTEANGGWASKSFAALSSRFEKVIVVDADAVFLQKPDVLLRLVGSRQSSSSSLSAAQSPGAFLFHDRLLWQHAFADRHAWWKDQIRRPSAILGKSLVWAEDYAEEGDSGVVVLDKSRPDILMGLLHICWQNTYDVREEVTYKLTYGDKESWWLGFELTGASYEMERHYGGIIGWEPAKESSSKQRQEQQGEGGPEEESRVCSFVIAHVDEKDKLLWYNGGLLKNKLTDANEYEVPQKWMIDGEWRKGAAKTDMSCMVGQEATSLTAKEHELVARSIELARMVDAIF